MTDWIKRMREKVESGELEITIPERRNGYRVVAEPKGNPFDIDDETFEIRDAFVEQLEDLVIDLKIICEEYPSKHTEQVWEIGRVVREHEKEHGDITYKNLHVIHPNNDVAEYTLRAGRRMYEMFPEGTDGDLPSIKRSTTFLKLVNTAKSKREVLEFHNTASEYEYGNLDVRSWNLIRDKEVTSTGDIIEVIQKVYPGDRYTDEKKAKTLRIICEMLDWQLPATNSFIRAVRQVER